MPKKTTKKKVSGKKTASRKKSHREEGVTEIFEIEDKKGNVRTVKKTVEVESKPTTKKQVDYENKLLRNLILIFVACVVVFIVVYIMISSANHFTYRGVKFDVVQEQDLTFYKTSFPAMYQGSTVPYNFYIRNDPRVLDSEIPFEGSQNLLDNMVINMTENFDCDGDGVIAIANFVKFYQFIGTKVIKDPNATCDQQGRYMFVQIQEGNSTEIKQTGPSCYELDVSDCEILKVTERFMIESFVKAQKVS